MDDSVNDHLGQRDVQPRQLLAKKLSLRFVEPPADLSFKRFEPALILPPTVPPFFNEIQQPLQGLPANNASRSLVTQLCYTFHGPISDGYPATKPSF